MRGECFHGDIRDVKFSVPRFVRPADFDDILPYLPAGETGGVAINRMKTLDINTPRTVGSHLVAKMSRFYHASNKVFQENADRLNRTYEIIAPSEEHSGKSIMTLGQIAMTVLQKEAKKIRPEMLWAVHRATVQSQNVKIDSFTSRKNIRYEIQPRRYLLDINKVQDWVRDFQHDLIENVAAPKATAMHRANSKNPIATFAKKAQARIKKSRRMRPLAPNGCLGPCSIVANSSGETESNHQVMDVQKLGRDDMTIIHYIDAWAMSRYLNPHTNLEAFGPLILRAVGMYSDFDLDRSMGLTFLQEFGVFPQWSNRLLYQTTDLRLPDVGSASADLNAMRTEAYTQADPSTPLQDSMKDLRKDWGDLPVFCIDSAETRERDDGISLELADGRENECWVHVHIANPSAYVTPTSAVAKYAAQLAQTVYLPERTYSMIPPSLTESQLSLAKGRPCLTFSAKISKQGDILAKKITPGRVHNVQCLTRQAVCKNLGIDNTAQSSEATLLTIGEEYESMRKERAHAPFQVLPEAHISILRRLLEVSQAAARQRKANSIGEITYSQDEATILRPYVYTDSNQVGDGMVGSYVGDPSIRLEKTTNTMTDPVGEMVENVMLLTGGVAASWCLERNIHIPYRGMVRNEEPEISPETFRNTYLDPYIAKYGRPHLPDLAIYVSLLGVTHVQASPLEHFLLGLPAYCKATSPLRRYVDFLTHWQIEAALRHEATTGKSLVGSSGDHSFLPFSYDEVQEFASTSLDRERRLKKAQMASDRHWIVQAFFRAFYFKEAPLPETFTVIVQSPFRWRQTCWIDGWGIRAYMEDNDLTVSNGGLRKGDRWEARITSINIYWKSIWMVPVRLIDRIETET